MSARHRKRKRDYTARDWRRLIARTEVQLADETDVKKQHVLDRRVNQAKRSVSELNKIAGYERETRRAIDSVNRFNSALEAEKSESQRLG